MTIDLTTVLGAVITLAVAIVSAVVIPLLKRKLGDEKYSEIQRWVKVAVQAAEQLFSGSGRGEEKLDYVLKFLESKGFTLDAASLRNLIESAVWELTNGTFTIGESIEEEA